MKPSAREERLGRQLYMLDARRAEDVESLLQVPSRRFISLVLWDATAASVNEVSRVVEALYSAGCVYLCAWGNDCSRVHDIADEIYVMATLGAADTPLLMSTWHEQDSLDDALRFFLTETQPSDALKEGCDSSVAVCIGQGRDRLDRIRFALQEPARFLAETAG